MFCEEDRIDDMNENSLNCFASTHFKSDLCTVASVGLPFEETMKLAEKVEYRRVSVLRIPFPCLEVTILT